MARQNATMLSVVPATMNMSVITAAEPMKPATDENSSTLAPSGSK